MSTYSSTRRSFLKASLAAGAFPFISGCHFFGGALKGKDLVNVAMIGVGARGLENLNTFTRTKRCRFVAFADTEIKGEWTLKARQKYPTVPCYEDFRVLLDKHAHELDAVIVSTPDFSHFTACMAAMQAGLSVYTEKPMGNSFREIGIMMAMAKKNPQLVTQMGNQGHSLANYYQAKEMAAKGLLNGVNKVVAHMNWARRWHKWNGSVKEMFPAGEAVPADLAFDLWLSQRPERPYNQNYIHGDWRCFYEYGNGALGDWGAHTFDTAWEFLNLGLPEKISVINMKGWTPVVFPMSSALAFHFPARSKEMPACDLEWWEGIGNFPELPQGFDTGVKGDTPSIGGVQQAKVAALNPGREIYFADGRAYQGASHGAELVSCNGEKLPSVKGQVREGADTLEHAINFLEAVKGTTKATSPFEVAGPLSQVMTLGCIAQKLNTNLSFDREAKRFVGADADVANLLLEGPAPRKGWEGFYRV